MNAPHTKFLPIEGDRDEQAALLSTLLDNTRENIYFKDATGRFTLINRALAHWFGLSDPGQAIGKTDFDFFTEEHAGRALEDEKEIMRTGRPLVAAEEKETWPDGRVTWVSTTKLPLFGHNGAIVGTCGISRDITAHREAQQKLEESESRYRQLLSAVPAYTYTVSVREGHPVATDHGAGSLAVTGYTAEAYRARPRLWIEMVHPEDRGRVLDYVHGVLDGKTQEPIEHRITRKDGITRWVSNTVVPHREVSGELIAYDGLIEDITRRKEAELALEQERRELEIRIAERTVELTMAVAQLQEHDRAKSEFVSNVSHELKNPLMAMEYAVQNLLQGVTGCLSDKTREYVSMIQADCWKLKSTIEDVLDLSRIEAKTMAIHRRDADLYEITRNAVRRMTLDADANQLEVAVCSADGPIVLRCDADKIERAIENVIRNAIKFTPHGGHIAVTLTRDNSGKGMRATVCVRDDGIGIAPEHLTHVTERYYRADESRNGTGLGLAICKEILELHGGGIEIESPPPGKKNGTEVRLCLPIQMLSGDPA